MNDQGVIFTSNLIKVNYINRTCENMKNMEMFQLTIERVGGGGGMAEGRRPLFLLETFLYIDEKK